MKQEVELQQLIEKVKSGRSTPEEDLTLLRRLNGAIRTYVAIADEILAIKAQQTAKQTPSENN